MKKVTKLSIYSLLLLGMSAVLLPARAQNLLPGQISDIFNLLGPQGSGSAGFVQSRIQLGLVLALGAVVLVAVVYAIMAALKYIQSQGDAGKIEEAQKAIKAIFLGIGAMLVAIVGIVLVFVFFGANRPDPSLFQTCLSAAGSKACVESCLIGENPRNADNTGYDTTNLCGKCELAYFNFASGDSTDDPGDRSNFDGDCAAPINQNP